MSRGPSAAHPRVLAPAFQALANLTLTRPRPTCASWALNYHSARLRFFPKGGGHMCLVGASTMPSSSLMPHPTRTYIPLFYPLRQSTPIWPAELFYAFCACASINISETMILPTGLQ